MIDFLRRIWGMFFMLDNPKKVDWVIVLIVAVVLSFVLTVFAIFTGGLKI